MQVRDPSADRLAIMDLLYRYCRSMDRMDRALGYSLWHEASYADYGAAIYQGSGPGFIDFAIDRHAVMIATSHQVTNIIIELEGDSAASEAWVMAALRSQDGAQVQVMQVWGRYQDNWSFKQGRWAIERRRYIHDFDEVRAIPAPTI